MQIDLTFSVINSMNATKIIYFASLLIDSSPRHLFQLSIVCIRKIYRLLLPKSMNLFYQGVCVRLLAFFLLYNSYLVNMHAFILMCVFFRLIFNV